ncbi:MAG: NAD(P)-dependent oxidoreductase [Verrucomicrobia bacterium]|nr:NAD(P)-dependent oxidoreductase [Verrucomicrobiota bacterium]
MDSGSSRVLMVGGLGYLGSRLAAALCERASVVLTARSLSPERQRWLETYRGQITGVQFDSARQDTLPVDGPFDCVINLAAPDAKVAAQFPDTSRAAAVRAAQACLDLLERKGAKRLLHFSSFHVYGAHARGRFSEEDAPQPTHPYGQIHLECERVLQSARNPGSIEILRPTNIVGAPAHSDLGPQLGLIFLDLCRQAVESGKLVLQTNGGGHRDFLAMADVMAAIDLLLDLRCNEPAIRLLNLSCGKTMRLGELAALIQAEAQEKLGTRIPIVLGQRRDSFASPFDVANQRLRQLGWSPSGNLKNEIRQILDFFRSRKRSFPGESRVGQTILKA